MRLERRAGAADGLEGDQLVRHSRLDAAILLNGNPLGRCAEDSDSALINLENSKSSIDTDPCFFFLCCYVTLSFASAPNMLSSLITRSHSAPG